MLGVALHGTLIFLVQTLSLSLETVEANQIFDIKQAARMPRLTRSNGPPPSPCGCNPVQCRTVFQKSFCFIMYGLICFRFRRRITK